MFFPTPWELLLKSCGLPKKVGELVEEDRREAIKVFFRIDFEFEVDDIDELSLDEASC